MSGTQFKTVSPLRWGAFALLLLTLAWAPFPFGGAVAWAPGLQHLLIAGCWAVWAFSLLRGGDEHLRINAAVVLPLVLIVLVLAWGYVQTVPLTPPNLAHPLWHSVSETLGKPVAAVISLEPWRSRFELEKLVSYGLAGCLAYFLTSRTKSAKLLLYGVIFIGAAYALYAFVQAILGTDQSQLLYGAPKQLARVSGPFLLHNSFATYCGMAAVAALAALIASASEHRGASDDPEDDTSPSVRLSFETLFLAISAALCLGGVLISGSRAGFVATLCALGAMTVASIPVARSTNARRLLAGFLAAGLGLLAYGLASGEGTLARRFGLLWSSDKADEIRSVLWSASERMIHDHIWFGQGLGTFQDAYPQYEVQPLPFVMDKAHCDYLELAAGLGVPAAIVLWTGLAWLALVCLRGVRVRQRNRAFPLAAFGAAVLVGVHSAVDFSLQLPAVALTFAVILGVGTAQAFSRHRNV